MHMAGCSGWWQVRGAGRTAGIAAGYTRLGHRYGAKLATHGGAT
ncbi:hypothetical protein IBTHAUMO2_50004 [Nitrosopumilaceae archaeon]|nr:hypothetical protein IBTHAUMO2_50004 [Nitrosopumilaceae archaeon]